MPKATPRFRQSDLRIGRHSEAGRAYFLTTVTHGRERLFSEWRQASQMSRIISAPSTWAGADLLCWVLMPDHWHGLLVVGNTNSLAKTMNLAKGRSAYRFNKETGRNGPVWAAAYFDHALRRDEDLRQVARYIISNPIRAGLASSWGSYPYWGAVWLDHGREVL
jgi:REP element-mobilizing transposase RayT